MKYRQNCMILLSCIGISHGSRPDSLKPDLYTIAVYDGGPHDAEQPDESNRIGTVSLTEQELRILLHLACGCKNDPLFYTVRHFVEIAGILAKGTYRSRSIARSVKSLPLPDMSHKQLVCDYLDLGVCSSIVQNPRKVSERPIIYTVKQNDLYDLETTIQEQGKYKIFKLDWTQAEFIATRNLNGLEVNLSANPDFDLDIESEISFEMLESLEPGKYMEDEIYHKLHRNIIGNLTVDGVQIRNFRLDYVIQFVSCLELFAEDRGIMISKMMAYIINLSNGIVPEDITPSRHEQSLADTFRKLHC